MTTDSLNGTSSRNGPTRIDLNRKPAGSGDVTGLMHRNHDERYGPNDRSRGEGGPQEAVVVYQSRVHRRGAEEH